MKKLILAAGSGYLGNVLIEKFKNDFEEIIVLTRGSEKIHGKIKWVNWDAKNSGLWQMEFENSSVVINLAGKNVNCRYTKKNKEEIISSRINSTQIIGATILSTKNPPEIWINCASATIYPHSENQAMTEQSKCGEGFSVEVCKAWEKRFFDFSLPKTRQICLRIGMILGNGGGVFPVLKKITRLGLGGTMGAGNQMVSWMDEVDFAEMVKWAIQNKKTNGIFNCTSPFPIINRNYASLIRKQMKMKIGLPAPSWLLEFGAFFIRTETELVLKSRFVIPEKALKEGFVFKYPKFEDCLNHLLPGKETKSL